jgi:hypothetical protein
MSDLQDNVCLTNRQIYTVFEGRLDIDVAIKSEYCPLMRLQNLLFAGLIAGFGVFVAAAQEGIHSIVRRDVYPNTPYEIVEWRIDDKPITDISHFTAASDWWQHVSLRAKNVSQNTITYYSFSLTIPQTGKMKTAVGMRLESNSYEALVDAKGRPTGKFGFRWRPGETLEFRLSENEIAVWNKYLKSFEITGVEKLNFESRFVYFEDGNQWSFGSETPSRAGQVLDPSKKVIRLRQAFEGAPVEPTSLSANGLTITPGESFGGGEDWLFGVTVRFKNISPRTVTCVRFGLAVLDSHPTGPTHAFWLNFGPPNGGSVTDRPISLPPGETGEAVFSPGDYQKMKTVLALSEDLTTRTTADLYLSEVYFTDGGKWSPPFGYQQRDPNDSRRWIPEHQTLLMPKSQP